VLLTGSLLLVCGSSKRRNRIVIFRRLLAVNCYGMVTQWATATGTGTDIS